MPLMRFDEEMKPLKLGINGDFGGFVEREKRKEKNEEDEEERESDRVWGVSPYPWLIF